MEYKICRRCVMDTSHSPEIQFDDKGICNYCKKYDDFVVTLPSREDRDKKLEGIIAKIKAEGKNNRYDCILGLSGGVDSSYLALKLHDMGVKPLLIQFDNGWNTELSVKNIQLIAEKCGFDLYTYVVDWNEFRDLQLSFFKASVRNIEAPSDHGIFATLYKMAKKHKVKYIISGVNYQTEFSSSALYGHRYTDLTQILDIHKKFGTVKLKTFPRLPYWKRVLYDSFMHKLEYVPMLNYLDYNKPEAIKELQERLGWKPYPGKHFESVITIFHQSYYLPVKFGLDKRRLHLGDMVRSGFITRDEALQELGKPPLPEPELKEITAYVAKKFEVSSQEFDKIVKQPPVEYTAYKNDDGQLEILKKISKIVQKLR